MALLEDRISIEKLRAYKFLGLRRSAWIEVLLFFLITLAIDHLFFSGTRFFFINPHPFWIIVVLISVQYGTNEGVMAAFFATLVFLLGNLPEQTLLQDKFAYITTLIKNPILWFTAAVIIGEVRTRQIRERDLLKKELSNAHDREMAITESYEMLKSLKEKIEVRIASELRTSLQIYEVFSKMEKSSPQEILLETNKLAYLLLHPTKCSVYALRDAGLIKVADTGWEADDSFAEEFSPSHALYEEIVSKQQTLSVINADQREKIRDIGVLLAPIIDRDTHQVYGMIKVEEIPFLQLKVPTVESAQIIGEWTGKTYTNRLALEAAQKAAYFDEGSQLFSASFFEYHRDYILQLAKFLHFNVSMIKIQLVHPKELSPGDRKRVAKIMRQAAMNVLRAVDLPFHVGKQGTEFAIILEGAKKKDAEVMMQKLRDSIKKENTPYQFEFHSHLFYDAS